MGLLLVFADCVSLLDFGSGCLLVCRVCVVVALVMVCVLWFGVFGWLYGCVMGGRCCGGFVVWFVAWC